MTLVTSQWKEVQFALDIRLQADADTSQQQFKRHFPFEEVRGITTMQHSRISLVPRIIKIHLSP